MNIDKLLEAIQLIVKDEVKKLRPVIKEAVKRETTKLIKEERKKLAESVKRKDTDAGTFMSTERLDDIDLDNQIPNSVGKRVFNTKSPIHDKLNETYQTYQGAPKSEDDIDETVTFDSSDVHGNVHGKASPELQRASLAAKMGYGDFAGVDGGPKSGLGEKTGHEHLDKALNRDYSELVKRFK